MRKLSLFVLLLLALISISTAEKCSILDNYYFVDIPEGWYIIENSSEKVVLTDNDSAIKIEFINISSNEFNLKALPYLQLRGHFLDYDLNELPPDFYKFVYELTPYYSTGILNDYYRNEILNTNGVDSGGDGMFILKPDDMSSVSYFYNQDKTEWVITWFTKEYRGLGIRAIFSGSYKIIDLEKTTSEEYSMQEPLYLILTSISSKKTNNIWEII